MTVNVGDVDPKVPKKVTWECGNSFCACWNKPSHDPSIPWKEAEDDSFLIDSAKTIACPTWRTIIQTWATKTWKEMVCPVWTKNSGSPYIFEYKDMVFYTWMGYIMLYLFLSFIVPIVLLNHICTWNFNCWKCWNMKPRGGKRRGGTFNCEGIIALACWLLVLFGIVYAFFYIIGLFLLPWAYVVLIRYHWKQISIENRLKEQQISI